MALPVVASKLIDRFSISSACLIFPTADEALDAYNDAQVLIRRGTVDCLLLPDWDPDPYSGITPSIRTRIERIGLLSKIHSPAGKPRLIFSSWRSAFQITPSRRFLESNRVVLRAGDTFEARDTLTRKLVELGYAKVELVEDEGTFSIRGEIIDLFPPSEEQPLRIELFDTQIERMRYFDVETQRSLDSEIDLQTVSIGPAREFVVSETNVQEIRERIKSFCDDNGISRAVRDPINHLLSNLSYPEYSDFWMPFAQSERETLIDHLPNDAIILIRDRERGAEVFRSSLKEGEERFRSLISRGTLIPPPEMLFSAPQSFKQKVILFDSVTLGDEVERVALDIRLNTDLPQNPSEIVSAVAALSQSLDHSATEIIIATSSTERTERIRFLYKDLFPRLKYSRVDYRQGSLSSGFRWPDESLLAFDDSELLPSRGNRKTARSSRRSRHSQTWTGLDSITSIAIGDTVVHREHGIGIYRGINRLHAAGSENDYLLIEYAEKDRLYIPIYRLDSVQRYQAGSDAVSLDHLGTHSFAKTKERAKTAIRKMAIDLLKIYAKRKISEGYRFGGFDGAFEEFENSFPFEETNDQHQAIRDVITDMSTAKVMDRLVCGDVGFGKTEVAMRAAYRAVLDGKQVAILVPTTVLCFQHENSFGQRFSKYPVRIASLSRFKTPKEQKSVLADLKAGKIDILIGTHRLLSKDITFKNLGLVIVDEEHRFGVEHKEKLKALRESVSFLTLTATPIPRTLHMALSGLRDISLISTPPADRLPIRTYVCKESDETIQSAIRFELARDGQVFYVHNRVQSLARVAEKIARLVPEAKVSIAHGQMSEKELEERVFDFYSKKSNILLCTSIIESGIDLPSANTIIIDRADTFGLAQLYQIRGRVGRSDKRAYAYLFIPNEHSITQDATKRLEVIQRFVELGSGFAIANHDLEIRGGGNFLGAEQSGQIAAIGLELYTELLEEAIHEIRGDVVTTRSGKEPEIKVPFSCILPDSYVSDVHQRLSIYRRLSSAESEEVLSEIESELLDRYGELPIETQHLLWLIRIKNLMRRYGVDSLTLGPERVSFILGSQCLLDPHRIVGLVARDPKEASITPDSKLTLTVGKISSLAELSLKIESLFEKLARPVTR